MKNVSDGDAKINSKKAIYDIGTEILFLHCFATTDMFLFCKKLIFSEFATHWPPDKDFLVKTPFWAIIGKTQKFVKTWIGSKFCLKRTKEQKKNIKKRRILALTRRILDENPPYFACPNLFTFSMVWKWSQDLGSLKMKV